jgi:hypothetical protein
MRKRKRKAEHPDAISRAVEAVLGPPLAKLERALPRPKKIKRRITPKNNNEREPPLKKQKHRRKPKK